MVSGHRAADTDSPVVAAPHTSATAASAAAGVRRRVISRTSSSARCPATVFVAPSAVSSPRRDIIERCRPSRPTGATASSTDCSSATEDVVYLGIALLLALGAGVLLVVAADQLLDVFDDFASEPVVEVLDTLLLVFIVVELLSAVRTTLTRRELVAEPFLIVGIIASIKEIVVLSVKAADDIGTGAAFRDQMWEIGVLAVVVLLLGATAWLLRRKEREPDEGSHSPAMATEA